MRRRKEIQQREKEEGERKGARKKVERQKKRERRKREKKKRVKCRWPEKNGKRWSGLFTALQIFISSSRLFLLFLIFFLLFLLSLPFSSWHCCSFSLQRLRFSLKSESCKKEMKRFFKSEFFL